MFSLSLLHNSRTQLYSGFVQMNQFLLTIVFLTINYLLNMYIVLMFRLYNIKIETIVRG